MRLVVAVRFIGILFVLLLLLPFAAAYTLSLKIIVSEGTLAPGTNVTLAKEGVEFSSVKADSKGFANFTVPEGSYFVLLRRGGYPLHVSLVGVDKDMNITLVMRVLISYANAYGTINGPSDFSNTTVSAISGGKAAKRVQADRNGYYLLQFLPEGNYELRFESPGFSPKSMQAFLQQSKFFEANAALGKPSQSQANASQAVLLVPSQVKLHSLIEVWLLDGDVPIAGKAITVDTPSGEIKIQTGEDGKARVNAATPGKYTFSYGASKATTTIAALQPQKENAPLPGKTQTAGLPAGQGGSANAAESSPMPNALFPLAGMGVAALALLIAIIWAAAKLARGEKKPLQQPASPVLQGEGKVSMHAGDEALQSAKSKKESHDKTRARKKKR